MTHSKQERLANIDLAMQLIFDRLGGQNINAVSFETLDDAFKDVFFTTWQELQGHHWIEMDKGTMGGNRGFQVTGDGWLFWIHKCDLLEDYRHSAIKICKAAKRYVEGRQDDGCVMLEELARDTGLSGDLIENIIESRLLQRLFPDCEMGLYWWDHVKGMSIRVPSQFGMEHL